MIVVENVTKYYGSRAAVRDLDFKIDQGECVGFLGLNGAGKTTTLRILSCLSLPTSGRVVIRGFDAEDQPHEIRKLIGFLPDQPPLYPEMSVRRYLEFAGKLRQMGAGELETRMPEVLETAGLREVADDLISTLSHGYKQRVGIAQAIVHRPALLILDEPIQGLDPVQIVEMREMIRRLRGKHTILLSSHILSEIQQTCDRILMLHQGRIAAQGTEDELNERFQGGVRVEIDVRLPKVGSDLPAGYREAPDADTTLAKLVQDIPNVSAVEVETPDHDDQRVVRFSASSDVRAEVARALVQAGYGLLRLEHAAEGLERIFIQLSKGGSA
jgi:ABC-2 type transport system ATP-binding protein